MDKLFKVVCNPNNPKILAIGKNYVKHVKEMGGDQVPKEPVIFTKPHSSLWPCPTNQTYSYQLPAHGREIHHEIELGLLIGRQATNAKESEWRDIVGGYFLGLDLTDRHLQGHFKKEGFPWDLAKGQVKKMMQYQLQDKFFPISGFVSIDSVNDPHDLELELKINEKIVQADTTATMFYKIPFLLSFLSQHMTLNVGDLILTGTPHGVGPIRNGDKLRGRLLQKDKTLVELNLDVK